MKPNTSSDKSLSPDALLLKRTKLFDTYRLHLEGPWTQETLQVMEEACFLFFGLVPDDPQFWQWVERLSVRLEQMKSGGLTSRNLVRLNPAALTSWTIVHELAHAWDASQGWKISAWMAKETGSGFAHPLLHRLFPAKRDYWYAVGSPPPPCGVDAFFNRREDFAESVSAYLFPDEAKTRADERGWGYALYGYSHFHETPRGQLIQKLLHSK